MHVVDLKKTAAYLVIVLFSASLHSTGKEKQPYPHFEEHGKAVLRLIEGHGDAEEVVRRIDADLDGCMQKGDIRKTGRLLTLRRAALSFSTVSDANRETALLLLDEPDWCSRFFHNLDRDDDLAGALSVIRRLHAHDPEVFSDKFEFCLAYAVVWDDFASQSWLDSLGTKKNGTMLGTFRHYLDNEKKMVFAPGRFPCEINIYVVGTRLSREERDWVLGHYRARGLRAHDLYGSVPWTLNDEKTLSPSHGKGLDIPYTLENIKEIGGCCMDQAYFTESILRLFGVPAVFASGSTHAWVGVAQPGPKDSLVWDFNVGGREDMRRMWRGRPVVDLREQYFSKQALDPTNGAGRTLNHTEVMLSGAFWSHAGSIGKIEESHHYLDAARWLQELPAENLSGEGDRRKREQLRHSFLLKSQKAGRFNIRTWRFLASCAEAGTLGADRARFWSGEANKHLIRDYPDFAVELLGALVKSMENEKKIKAALETAFKIIEKERSDLVCDLKIVEAEVWFARQRYARGVRSLVFLIENFSNTGIAWAPSSTLNIALARLVPIVESQIKDAGELIPALESLFEAAGDQLASARHDSPREQALAALQKECAGKLFLLHTDQGNPKKAKRYSGK